MTLTGYRAELHVHTVLSPCAEIEMIPPLIVQEALARDISIIAVTDHNTSGNAGAVMRAAQGTGLAVLPGMELQTREEVHCLCLFESLDQAEEFERWVRPSLPPIPNKPDYFGEQFVVDETGDFNRREEQLLLVSSRYSINEAFQKVASLGGLLIPAHINRSVNGLIPVLGFIPPDIPFEALEISRHIRPDEAREKHPQAKDYPLIRSGDVHRLEEFLGVNEFTLAAPTLSEIRMAFQNREGRCLKVLHS